MSINSKKFFDFSFPFVHSGQSLINKLMLGYPGWCHFQYLIADLLEISCIVPLVSLISKILHFYASCGFSLVLFLRKFKPCPNKGMNKIDFICKKGPSFNHGDHT